MAVDTQVVISFRLPPAVAAEMRRHVEEMASPSAVRSELSSGAAARAAVDAFILWRRAEASSAPVTTPASPIPRQRSRAIPVPPQTIARHAAG